MSPELHDILSKAQRLEEDGVDQADAAKTANEVKLEEETPLQQEADGEVQLKQQTLLKQDNEEEQPLQNNTHAEESREGENGELKVSQTDEVEVKDEAGKQELIQEDKTEKASSPGTEAVKEEAEEKQEKGEVKEESPPPAPQE